MPLYIFLQNLPNAFVQIVNKQKKKEKQQSTAVFFDECILNT
jgi:hypothetical protein